MDPEQDPPEAGVIACDSIVTVPKANFDPEPVGSLGLEKRVELDRALRFALDTVY